MRATTRAALEKGLACFNAGAYWAAHEAWEEAWREEAGEVRELLHGLILAAAGWVQRGRGREAGARTLFARALSRLQALAPDAAGLEVGQLVSDLERWRDGARLPPARLAYRPA